METKRHSDKATGEDMMMMRMECECMECGREFRCVRSPVRCPKCGGVDLELEIVALTPKEQAREDARTTKIYREQREGTK